MNCFDAYSQKSSAIQKSSLEMIYTHVKWIEHVFNLYFLWIVAFMSVHCAHSPFETYRFWITQNDNELFSFHIPLDNLIFEYVFICMIPAFKKKRKKKHSSITTTAAIKCASVLIDPFNKWFFISLNKCNWYDDEQTRKIKWYSMFAFFEQNKNNFEIRFEEHY